MQGKDPEFLITVFSEISYPVTKETALHKVGDSASSWKRETQWRQRNSYLNPSSILDYQRSSGGQGCTLEVCHM